MEHKIVNISPYVYKKGMEYEKILPGDTSVKMTLKGIDVALIRSLAKYGLLNRRNLERAVSMQLPEQLKKPDYKKEIRSLRDAGYLTVYRYPEKEDEILSGRENTVLYGLSDKGIKEAGHRKIKICHPQPQKGEKYKTAAALELAQLNQWHLSIKRLYPGLIKEEYYEQLIHVMSDKGAVVKSIFHLCGKGLFPDGNITLAALPYPKECDEWKDDGKSTRETARGAFLNSLLSMNAYFKERKSLHNPMIVVLVDGFPTMEKAYYTIYTYKLLQNMPVYFCMDIHTDGDHVLNWLYLCSMDENNTSRQIHFKVADMLYGKTGEEK